MSLRPLDWRAAFARWQPYASLAALCCMVPSYPTVAFVILAVWHWCALDEIRTRKPLQIDLGIATQAAAVERKHKFCGERDDMTITNQQVYRVGTRHYLVQVSRASHDLKGNELA